ncbi:MULTISPECIES: heavy-metal-associated domain-containing protein [Aquimarina]|uniref:Heavy-metal-associated domain-containing protein n=1 Tax=Aquimarina algiphila TaxID=2047982 RepID=A0A554VGR1_9FLAO|nr:MULTISPECIES: heavy metal-associated domain-containing protein [Aquimarina]TSE06568.1 heavy-metal-associated domain-containing protein [Aquimarina algiphila]
MRTTIEIQNLKCSGCENTIAKKLHALEGIKDICINVNDCSVSFSYKTHQGLETVRQELLKLGYPIKGDKNNFNIKAKSYVSCAIGRVSK